jgi:hypothetical protein
VIATGKITGYSVFHYTPVTGDPSEGTIPLESTFAPSFVMPYEGTASFTTGAALTNLATTQTVVTATVYNEAGNQLATKTINLPSNGHTSFMLADQFPGTVGHRGIIEFKTSGAANISGLALRVNPDGGFTSTPLLRRP